MYVNPFWAGVAATILFEFAALIARSIVRKIRKELRYKRGREMLDKQLRVRTRGE